MAEYLEMGDPCPNCGVQPAIEQRTRCLSCDAPFRWPTDTGGSVAQVARLEAEAAPLRAALEQLKNVAKGIAHCYDELDEDERRELQQVCAESEAILLKGVE